MSAPEAEVARAEVARRSGRAFCWVTGMFRSGRTRRAGGSGPGGTRVGAGMGNRKGRLSAAGAGRGAARCLSAAGGAAVCEAGGRRGGQIVSERRGNAGCALPAAVDIQPACLGLYCGRTVLSVNGSVETYGDCGVSAAPEGLGLGRGDGPAPSRAGPGIGSAGRTAPHRCGG